MQPIVVRIEDDSQSEQAVSKIGVNCRRCDQTWLCPRFALAVLRLLPSELVDIVIDYLHADVSTLKACNLVCKSWQPRSRYHLFAYLHLDLSLPTKSLQRILLQIAKPNSYFRTSIRDISLRSEVAPQWQHDLSALATLRNLTSISLSNWHNAMPDPYWFHSAFNVTHLEITSCRIDCSGLGVLLRQLPMIESFKLANTSWKDPFDIDRATHCGGLLKHLRKLHLGPRSSSILSAMVALISERIIEGRLEEVELEEVEMRYEMMVADLLAAAGKSLLSLVISAKYRLSESHELPRNKPRAHLHWCSQVISAPPSSMGTST
ncbi:hypothetical protein C0991_003339 [Blastosporella zonata]|nr:hypothetical protein C0991_003339 [Blastosporella zonata]